jgi:hypothetical protein
VSAAATPTPARTLDPRLPFVVAVAAMCLGAWLRVLGITTCELWADEAWWANKLIEGNPGWIRPPGYMWLTRQVLALGRDELTLRAVSLVAGIAQLPLAYVVLRRVVRPWLAVVGTLVIAVHPVLVAFSKEFKPYTLEGALHLAMAGLALAYVARPRTGLVVGLAAVAVASPSLSWSTVFAYPAAFLAVLGAAFVARRWRDLGLAGAAAAVTLAELAVIFALRLADKDPHPEYWGRAYGVFFLGDSVVDGFVWYATRTAELVSSVSSLRFVFGRPDLAFEPVALSLFVLGVVALLARRARRRSLQPLVLLLPWLIFVVFNVAGQWPYGLFRTNIFILAYAVVIATVGLDELLAVLQARAPRVERVLAAVVVALALLALPVEPARFASKGRGTLTANSDVVRAVRLVEAAASDAVAPPFLAVDGQACSTLSFYRDHHTTLRGELATSSSSAATVCSKGRDPGWRLLLDEVVAAGHSFFVVNAKRSTARHTAAVFAQRCLRWQRTAVGPTTVLWCGLGDGAVVPALAVLREGRASTALAPPPDDEPSSPPDEGPAAAADDEADDDGPPDR